MAAHNEYGTAGAMYPIPFTFLKCFNIYNSDSPSPLYTMMKDIIIVL